MKLEQEKILQFLISLAALVLPALFATGLDGIPTRLIYGTPFPMYDYVPSIMIGLLIGGAFLNLTLLMKKTHYKILAGTGLLLYLFFCGMWVLNFIHNAQPDTKANEVKYHLSMLSDSIETYRENRGAYPPHATGADGFNNFLNPENPNYSLPTFSNSTHEYWWPLGFPRDPFLRRMAPGATYVYYTDGTGFILLSPGPDSDYDIDPLPNFAESPSWNTTTFIPKTYDPTNSAHSDGDIFLIYFDRIHSEEVE